MPSRDELLHEGVLAKFLRYVQIDSPSDEAASTVPSTPQQWEMARCLEEELRALGLPEVRLTDHGIVLGTLPASPDLQGRAPVIGLLAHYDTFGGVPGTGIRPIVHRHYDGGEIRLPAGPVLSPVQQPDLLQVVGHDLVTSDGRTLLGADDKAGVAEIMEAVCRLLREPQRLRPTVRVAFTPDEETGRGIQWLDVAELGCQAAYTLDGSGVGELSGENFDALNVVVTFTGKSAHTGTARGRMVNALYMAADLISAIPATMRPETTDGHLGFLHPDSVEGKVEEVRVRVLLRDFTREGLKEKQALLEEVLEAIRRRYPGGSARLEVVGGYENMARALQQRPEILQFAREAIRRAGLTVVERPIRGGTDGAHLSARGLPTPNLFTGGMNYHSRTEWVSVQWMEKAVEVVLNLLELWARHGRPG